MAELKTVGEDYIVECHIEYMPTMKEFSIRLVYETGEIDTQMIAYVDAEELKNTIRMLENED
jgi:hypothetical protein